MNGFSFVNKNAFIFRHTNYINYCCCFCYFSVCKNENVRLCTKKTQKVIKNARLKHHQKLEF
jgi:hypothetical protein